MHMNNCQNENNILNMCLCVWKESKTEGWEGRERKSERERKKERERLLMPMAMENGAFVSLSVMESLRTHILKNKE